MSYSVLRGTGQPATLTEASRAARPSVQTLQASSQPATLRSGDLVEPAWKSHEGYRYRALGDKEAALVVLLISGMRIVGTATIHLDSLSIPVSLIGWDPNDKGDLPVWMEAERAKGNAILLSGGETLPGGAARIDGEPSGGVEGYVLSTRDIASVAAICRHDTDAGVVYEPSAGWLLPGQTDDASEEAGIAPSTLALAAGAAVLIGAGVYYMGRKG